MTIVQIGQDQEAIPSPVEPRMRLETIRMQALPLL